MNSDLCNLQSIHCHLKRKLVRIDEECIICVWYMGFAHLQPQRPIGCGYPGGNFHPEGIF